MFFSLCTVPSDDVDNVFISLLSAATINCKYLKIKSLFINWSIIVLVIFNWMLNTIPFGIQDTQPHTLILPTLINSAPTGRLKEISLFLESLRNIL
jgi:hypothetical protein